MNVHCLNEYETSRRRRVTPDSEKRRLMEQEARFFPPRPLKGKGH